MSLDITSEILSILKPMLSVNDIQLKNYSIESTDDYYIKDPKNYSYSNKINLNSFVTFGVG